MLKAKKKLLPHFEQRPPGIDIDTFVIHSMFCPGASDPFDALACIDLLDQHKVSAHYVIDRLGALWRLVDERDKAWHAGASKMPFKDDGREGVNAFSIGVELIGSPDEAFTEEQYRRLAELTKDIMSRHPIRNIVGHEHIAPSRKQDPGVNFSWNTYRKQLSAVGLDKVNFNFGG